MVRYFDQRKGITFFFFFSSHCPSDRLTNNVYNYQEELPKKLFKATYPQTHFYHYLTPTVTPYIFILFSVAEGRRPFANNDNSLSSPTPYKVFKRDGDPTLEGLEELFRYT